jgi:hypothetical protein
VPPPPVEDVVPTTLTHINGAFEQRWLEMLTDLAAPLGWNPRPLSQQRLMLDWQFWSIEAGAAERWRQSE